MSKIVLFDQPGAAEVQRIADVAVAAPGPHDVQIRVKAIGLNRSDLIYRCGAHPPQPPDQLQVLQPRQMAVYMRLFRYVTKLRTIRRKIVANVPAFKENLSLRRLDQPDHHLYRGRLPGAVRPKVAKNLTFF